jgi:TP901-1 family phage major tail protein
MAAVCGSGVIVSFKDDAGSPAYQVVAGLKSRRIALNAETVDITNADSTGRWRELLDTCGVRSASISGDGVFVDDAGSEAVRDAFFENELRDAKILIPSWGTFEGKFKVSQMEISAEFNDAAMVSLTLESAGELTFTGA